MNYQETIDYLYHTLPMFSHLGSAAYKKDLDNTITICNFLGNPQDKFKSIHVAGTNGKGSVSHMLAAIFQTAGYKTGLYTSPHLYDFRERIRINGMMADENFVIRFVEKIKPLIESIHPSFFEITVAMAFEYFAENDLDIAIIETGMGGRLDSTNIIRPKLSIITNISWDHMNILGDTLQKIASEKAGIIKENIPVVIGEKKQETETVFRESARSKNADLFFATDDYVVEDFELSEQSISIAVLDKKKDKITTYELDLAGIYQLKNITTVLQSVELLGQWKISEENIIQALRDVKKLTGLHGRWELIHQDPNIILEVAHNKDGISQMLGHLKKLDFARLHLVIGMVKDKDIDSVLELLPTDASYYFTQSQIPRALDARELLKKANEFNLQGEQFTNVNLALRSAIRKAEKNDLIIVCGSIFLVAEVNISLITEHA